MSKDTNRIVITQPGGKFRARFQQRHHRFFWRTVGQTQPRPTLQACLADVGQAMTEFERIRSGNKQTRQQRRETARQMARMFQ